MKSTLPENSEGVSCLREYKRFFRLSAALECQRRPSHGILTTLITPGSQNQKDRRGNNQDRIT
jgi:hypothetical protein